MSAPCLRLVADGRLTASMAASFDDAYDVITFENNTLGQSYPGVIILESHRGFVNPDGEWTIRYVYNDSRVDESIAAIPLNMTQTILSRWSKLYNHSKE